MQAKSCESIAAALRVLRVSCGFAAPCICVPKALDKRISIQDPQDRGSHRVCEALLFIKDRRRDEYLKLNGFKVLRIKSRRLVPDKDDLFSNIDYLIEGSSSYSEIVLEDYDASIKKEEVFK